VTRHSVLLLPDAEAEIREAFLWYRDRSAIAAEAFLDELFGVVDGRTVTVLAVAHHRRMPGYWRAR
jgi:plasmid stabilization system protein ParE